MPAGVSSSGARTVLTGFTQTYATADKTLAAYTPDAESGAFTSLGAGVATVLNNTNVAKLDDLNALRVAYENLRAFTEDLAQLVNSIIDDLEA